MWASDICLKVRQGRKQNLNKSSLIEFRISNSPQTVSSQVSCIPTSYWAWIGEQNLAWLWQHVVDVGIMTRDRWGPGPGDDTNTATCHQTPGRGEEITWPAVARPIITPDAVTSSSPLQSPPRGFQHLNDSGFCSCFCLWWCKGPCS